MTIQQLRQFCILAEYENITLASKALFITQPALSMVLKNVEKELGLPLFDRKGRNIYLNHLGKDFYNFAKRTLADYDALLEKFRAPHQSVMRCISAIPRHISRIMSCLLSARITQIFR